MCLVSIKIFDTDLSSFFVRMYFNYTSCISITFKVSWIPQEINLS